MTATDETPNADGAPESGAAPDETGEAPEAPEVNEAGETPEAPESPESSGPA